MSFTLSLLFSSLLLEPELPELESAELPLDLLSEHTELPVDPDDPVIAELFDVEPVFDDPEPEEPFPTPVLPASCIACST